MEAIDKSQKFYDGLFSGMSGILSKVFLKKDTNYDIHAELLLSSIKSKEFEKEKYLEIVKNLDEKQWNSKYVIKTLNELNSIIGITEDFIKNNAAIELNKTDLNKVLWEISKKIVLNYAKHSKELHDSLKYSNISLSLEKEILLNKLMKALNVINKTANELINKYQFKNYNSKSVRKFLNTKLIIDHLLLRINYILLNAEKEEKYSMYGNVLSSEVIEYTLIKTK